NRDARQSELVNGALARGGFAVAVADIGLLDLVELDAGVLEGLGTGLERHVGVVPLLGTGLFELRHADADYESAVAHLFPSRLLGGEIRGPKCTRIDPSL